MRKRSKARTWYVRASFGETPLMIQKTRSRPVGNMSPAHVAHAVRDFCRRNGLSIPRTCEITRSIRSPRAKAPEVALKGSSTRRGVNQPRRHQFRVVQRSAHEWGWELVNLGSGDVVARNGHGYSGQRQASAAVSRLRRLVVGHHLGHGYLDPAVEVVPLRFAPKPCLGCGGPRHEVSWYDKADRCVHGVPMCDSCPRCGGIVTRELAVLGS